MEVKLQWAIDDSEVRVTYAVVGELISELSLAGLIITPQIDQECWEGNTVHFTWLDPKDSFSIGKIEMKIKVIGEMIEATLNEFYLMEKFIRGRDQIEALKKEEVPQKKVV